MASKTEELAEQIVGGVQAYVTRCFGTLAAKMKELETRFAALPAADQLRGAKGDTGGIGKAGELGAKGETGQDGKDGQDGRDGEPGRDAPHVDVLDGIDEAKRYQRGTWATWHGGVIRAFRATDPLVAGEALEKSGWHVVMRGLADVSADMAADMRTVTLTLGLTGGMVVRKALTIHTMVYRGVYREGEAYAKADTTTRGGSLWVANTDSPPGKPGDENSGWQLAVKKGTDGRDGLKGDKGDRGGEGRAGKDLAATNPGGARW